MDIRDIVQAARIETQKKEIEDVKRFRAELARKAEKDKQEAVLAEQITAKILPIAEELNKLQHKDKPKFKAVVENLRIYIKELDDTGVPGCTLAMVTFYTNGEISRYNGDYKNFKSLFGFGKPDPQKINAKAIIKHLAPYIISNECYEGSDTIEASKDLAIVKLADKLLREQQKARAYWKIEQQEEIQKRENETARINKLTKEIKAAAQPIFNKLKALEAERIMSIKVEDNIAGHFYVGAYEICIHIDPENKIKSQKITVDFNTMGKIKLSEAENHRSVNSEQIGQFKKRFSEEVAPEQISTDKITNAIIAKIISKSGCKL